MLVGHVLLRQLISNRCWFIGVWVKIKWERLGGTDVGGTSIDGIGITGTCFYVTDVEGICIIWTNVV